LGRCFGAREANVVRGERSTAFGMIMSAAGLVVLLAVCLAYQMAYRK
jgi:hypothetical protein